MIDTYTFKACRECLDCKEVWRGSDNRTIKIELCPFHRSFHIRDWIYTTTDIY